MSEDRNEVALKRDTEEQSRVVLEHVTRFYETDQTGFINQTNYSRWLEEARMDFMARLGLDYLQLEEAQIQCPLISETINYNGLIKFGETVIIETEMAEYDGSRMTLKHELKCGEDGQTRATAVSTHCFVNHSGIPISMKRIYPELETRFFEFK